MVVARQITDDRNLHRPCCQFFLVWANSRLAPPYLALQHLNNVDEMVIFCILRITSTMLENLEIGLIYRVLLSSR